VIEQAKGIIMAQCGWPEDQAFDALRRASQRENVKVRDLAAQIVAKTARPASAQRLAGPAPADRPASAEVTPARTPAVRSQALAHRQGPRRSKPARRLYSTKVQQP
jgi:hypothetical protein